jgi:hypothetical protein
VGTVNTQLLQTLTQLWRTRADAAVTVDGGRIHRTLHVAGGELVGADSDVHTERLGVQLVAWGLLDANQVEPLVTRAQSLGSYFGEQLVADGLLSAEAVAEALERQALQRFDRTLTMVGTVRVVPRPPRRGVLRRPLGAEIFQAFRQRLPLSAASGLLADLQPRNDRLNEDFFPADELALTEAEHRCYRQLASGQGASAVLDRASDADVAIRLLGALCALGAVGVQEVDPVQALLRTA